MSIDKLNISLIHKQIKTYHMTTKTDDQILQDFIDRMSPAEKEYVNAINGKIREDQFRKTVNKSTSFAVYRLNVKISEVQQLMKSDKRVLASIITAFVIIWISSLILLYSLIH